MDDDGKVVQVIKGLCRGRPDKKGKEFVSLQVHKYILQCNGNAITSVTYIDSLSDDLNKSSVGCHVANICVNHLSYADDMVILAPSVRALQKLLDVCFAFAIDHDIVYNTRKSVCMIIWPKKARLTFTPSFHLCGERLDFVKDFLYLGHNISCDLSDDQDKANC